MGQIKLLSFDLFETLVHFKSHNFNSRETLDRALRSSPDAPKIPFEDLFDSYYRIIRSHMRNYEIEEEISNDKVLLDIWKSHQIVETSRLREIAKEIMTNYFSDVVHLIEPFPDVSKTLKLLKDEGLILILTSNHSWSQNGQDILNHFNLHQFFDQILFSADIGFRKPSPRIFKQISNLYPNIKNDSIIHCGDDLIADISGALKYGFKASWINRAKMDTQNADIQNHPNFLGSISEIKEIRTYIN
ncbi:MAG: HAD family hydrolase [Candidatus Hodarchaeales archaeon]|jgi:HAD superfamily hydrolase (TIGR01549 family)